MNSLLLTSACATIACAPAACAWAATGISGDRPNILWLTFEDTSAYELGCYGGPARTPNIDRLAREGIRFDCAWSNGVQCSPARSTIIHGRYATSLGTDVHRAERKVPPEIHAFPKYLKEAGYFTTNNAKTDYNRSNYDKEQTWSASGKGATYNDPRRAEGQPFFSVFNTMMTHMSRLTTITTAGRRVGDLVAEGLDPQKLALPPHVPDLPEVRSDYALHLEGVEDVDAWVGLFLEDLKNRGLERNTIIFVFADHGGCLPRGKGFVFQTGLWIPFVVHVPDRWRHLATAARLVPGSPSGRPVSFVDFAPTALSLAGIDPASVPSFQGQALLGSFAAGVRPRECNFGFTANREDNYSPARAVSDGDFLYIRNYIPRRPLALRNLFQWRMPSNLAWDAAYLSGGLEAHHRGPFGATPAEQLFDLRADPFNTANLAGDPTFAAQKSTLAARLAEVIADGPDLGFFTRAAGGTKDLPSWVADTRYPIAELHEIALRASVAAADDFDFFKAKLRGANRPEIRYWAANGLAELAWRGVLPKAPDSLRAAAGDCGNDEIAAIANEVLVYLGGDEVPAAVDRLVDLLGKGSREAHVVAETIALSPQFRGRLVPAMARLEEVAAGPDHEPATGDDNLDAVSVLVNLYPARPGAVVATGARSTRFNHPAAIFPESAVSTGRAENQRRRPAAPLP